jgi:hypothetical protein
MPRDRHANLDHDSVERLANLCRNRRLPGDLAGDNRDRRMAGILPVSAAWLESCWHCSRFC